MTDIRDALGMGMNLRRGMPSLSGCTNKSVDEFDDESKSRLVQFVVSTISNLCTFVFPKDPATVEQICAENIVGRCSANDAKLLENLTTVIKVLPPKSLWRRVLLAAVASSYSSVSLRADFGLSNQTIVSSREILKCLQIRRVPEPDS